MTSLNNLELSIFERLSAKYPDIKDHIPFLIVISRQITGVGMYVNFTYSDAARVKKLLPSNTFISTNDNIQIEGLKDGLGYEVDITDGMIKFIEMYTYGEDWDGNVDTFSIIESI